MVKIFCRSYLLMVMAGMIFLAAGAAAFATEPPRTPRMPEPFSPLIPSPNIGGFLQSGDPQRGERIYQSWGCTTCHSLDGRGRKMGPDLSRVGELHTDPYWFRRYLSEPRSIIPSSVKPPVRLPQPDMDDLIAYMLSLKKFR